MLKSPSKLIPAILMLAGPAAWAAEPASGEITEEVLRLEWAGSGPYLFTNVTPFVGGADTVTCEPSIPQTCDEFTLNVNIAQEFRDLEENKRESARIGITFPQDPQGQVDYDLYVYDAAGNLVGDSAGSAPQTSETVIVPLKTLKNGNYLVHVIPFTPLGTDYTGAAQVGKDAAAAKAAGFSVAPLAGTAPMTVSFDARGLTAQAPAGGYVFDFGDGSAPITDADGVLEYTYLMDGQYLARVRYSDTARGKSAAGATQAVFVGALEVGAKAGTHRLGGSLGLGLLFGLAGLGVAGRLRRRGA